MRCPAAGAIALALVLPIVTAAGQGDVLWGARAGFGLAIPAGWRLTRDLPGWGLALQPADPRLPAVELTVWPASVGVESAADVAQEHEQVLRMRWRYSRVDSEPIRTSEAGPGVYVEGLVASETGEDTAALFVAFYSNGRAYVLGTFCRPADRASVRRDVLMPVVERLALRWPGASPGEIRVSAGAPPGARAVLDVLDVLGRNGPESSNGAGAITPAAGLPPTGGGGGPIRYVHPSGFSLSLQEGWDCRVEGPIVSVTSPNGTTAFIEPLVRSGRRRGAVAAVDLASECVAALTGARMAGWAQESQGTASLVRADIDMEGREVDGVFQLAENGTSALLTGLVGDAEAMPREAADAATILASFEPRLSLADPLDGLEAAEVWADSLGTLTCERVNGWRFDGGVETYDQNNAIHLTGRSDDGAWFLWAQPVRPIFRDLTEPMRRLGFRDGDPYYAYEGVDARMVLSRGSAADLVMGFLVPQGMLTVRNEPLLVGETPLTDVSLLDVGEGETALVEVTGGPGGEQRYAWCVVSQSLSGESRNGWFWEAACIAFGGRPGRASDAARALQRAVGSAEVTRSAGPELASLVERTAQAARAESWADLVGDVVLRPVLTGGTGEERGSFSVPPAADDLWAAVAQSGRLPAPEAGR